MTEETDDGGDAVAFNITPEQMTALLSEAASKPRTVIEFRTTETGGRRELSHAVEITDHVETLEDNHDTQPPTNDSQR